MVSIDMQWRQHMRLLVMLQLKVIINSKVTSWMLMMQGWKMVVCPIAVVKVVAGNIVTDWLGHGNSLVNESPVVMAMSLLM